MPRPATLPLPGGQDGAAVRVRPLLAAEMLAPPGFLDRSGGPLGLVRGMGLHVPRSRWTWTPIPAFLVEHPGAGPVLVDTGFDASVARDPAINLGRAAKLLFTFRVTAEQALPAQLRALGTDPADVRTVVMTHLHYDHASGAGQFPDATFVVDAAEHAFAAEHGIRDGYVRGHLDGLDVRTVEGEVDLFGDGSVRLVPTPGHSPGHRSVLLRLADREVLLTGDALNARRLLHADHLPLFVWDAAAFRRSLTRLQALVAERPDAVVVAGHDAEGWPDVPALLA